MDESDLSPFARWRLAHPFFTMLYVCTVLCAVFGAFALATGVTLRATALICAGSFVAGLAAGGFAYFRIRHRERTSL